jgi:heme exporter protein C
MKRRAGRFLGTITGRRGERILGVSTIAFLAVSAGFSLVVSPPDRAQGDLVRMMYVHVPAAWVAYLAFTVVFVASVAYLRTESSRWDRLAAASAEVGVLYTGLAIVLGSLWARPVWGTWWSWDPRLTTTAILLLIYLGYLSVRRLPESPLRRARWSAVIGIVGFIDVPIVHVSVRWWRSLHQAPARLLGIPDVAPSMGIALSIALVAFTVAYVYLVVLRMRVMRLEDRRVLERMDETIGPGLVRTFETEAVPRG